MIAVACAPTPVYRAPVAPVPPKKRRIRYVSRGKLRSYRPRYLSALRT